MILKIWNKTKIQHVSEDDIAARLERFVSSRDSNVLMKDDLSSLNPKQLNFLDTFIWIFAGWVKPVKKHYFGINPVKTIQSFKLVEKKIALHPNKNKKLTLLFKQAIHKFNELQSGKYLFYPSTLMVHSAVNENDLKSVILLIRNDRHYLFYTNENGETPLHIAIKKGYDAIANFLITENPYPFEVDNQNRTPLHLAVTHNRQNIVGRIINKFVHWEIDSQQFSHLIQAAKELGNLEVVRMLTDYRAKVLNRYY